MDVVEVEVASRTD